MSKVNVSQRVPPKYSPDVIAELFRIVQDQINQLSEGRQSAYYAARTAAPTTGLWAKGDWVKNSNPSEAGSAGGMYVVSGWVCTVSGEPGTWKEMRVLTGN